MKKKYTFLIGSQLILLCFFIFSCDTHKQYSNAYSSFASTDNYSKPSSNNEGQLVNLDPSRGWKDKRKDLGERIEPKIVYTAFITLTIKQIDSTNNALNKIAKKYNGYVSETGTNRAVIRVKSESLDSAVQDIELLGRVDSKSIHGNDVTERYLDLTIRLENAEKARKRYLELLDKAENVKAALMVEKELERLNNTIDLLKGQLNSINHLSTYSTITISLNQKKKPGILGYIGIGVYRSVKWLFIRG